MSQQRGSVRWQPEHICGGQAGGERSRQTGMTVNEPEKVVVSQRHRQKKTRDKGEKRVERTTSRDRSGRSRTTGPKKMRGPGPQRLQNIRGTTGRNSTKRPRIPAGSRISKNKNSKYIELKTKQPKETTTPQRQKKRRKPDAGETPPQDKNR